LPYDEKLVEQGRNFSNKIWNAFRLVKGWETGKSEVPVAAIHWFRARLNAAIAEVLEHYDKFRMSDALLATYNLIWNDFCSQYLEMVKPAYVNGAAQPVDPKTYQATIGFFDELMRLAHPWIPFISEEIWQSLAARNEGDSICVQPFPKGGEADPEILGTFEILTELVSWVRNTRQSKQLSPKESLPLGIRTATPERYAPIEPLIRKLANIDTITYTREVSGMTYVIKGDEFGLDLGGNLDAESERENLQKELEYTLGFRKSVEAKLSNERFVANAKPEIVEREKAKLADADAKIQAIREALNKL
ncbi:MAG: class I tRNA ligase family protein, partial [Leadbetterella sp.]|nr:class I tRNA ligase family protein [Leadbetterella sp.]